MAESEEELKSSVVKVKEDCRTMKQFLTSSDEVTTQRKTGSPPPGAAPESRPSVMEKLQEMKGRSPAERDPKAAQGRVP